MKKKAIMATFMAAALVAASLSGCGNSSKPAETTAKAETEASGEVQESTEQSAASETADTKDKKDLREVNVVLDWYPNAIHTFLYTAIERGYYEEEGLDVQIRFPSNANDALSMVAAGKAEIGMYYQQDLIQAVANQKAPIRSVGAIVQSPLNIILSLKDKNITSPKDMVGKTIGYGGTVLSESLVKCMMESVGADASDVKMVDVGFDLMSSMTTGNVDATIGCLVNHEVPQMEEEGFDVTLRLSPLIEEYLDFDYLNRLPVDKVLVEFLRVNGWIKKWFPDLDYQKYVLRQSGYWHLPLEEKIRILEKIHLPLTVCEDVTEHYEYWKQHINPNPLDCCNLRK